MTTPLSITFNETTQEADRSIIFGNQSSLKSNEYNVTVIGTNGNSLTGTVPGVITLNAYSPFADRPEPSDETVDLSTNCRKFTLFRATINRAVFAVTGLPTDARVVMTAIRSA